jgi:AcrR family transcriptional regulator
MATVERIPATASPPGPAAGRAPAGRTPAARPHPGRASAARTTYAEAARELLRETLLDGARDELQRRSWAEITMGDIAAAAGVSRQTLYKEFGSRDEFAQAFVMREVDRFLAAVEVAVREHLDDPATALSAAFDVFLTAAAEDPLVRTLLSGEEAYGLLALVTTQAEPVVAGASAHLSAIILAGWPQVDSSDAQLLAECLVRLAISYTVLPAGPAGMTAASVTTLLGPYIERVLDQAATG